MGMNTAILWCFVVVAISFTSNFAKSRSHFALLRQRGPPRIPACVTPSSPSPLVHRRETCPLGWDGCFRDEGFQNRRVSRQNLTAKSLHMKLDRRFDVSHRFVVCVAVTHYDAFQAKRVRDVAIRVLFDDNLELPLLAGLHLPRLLSVCHIPAVVGQALPPANARLRALFPQISFFSILFFVFLIFPSLSKDPRRVRLVLVRPPLLPACRIVRVRILRVPACQRYRKHQVVVRPFPPRGTLLVAGSRDLHLHRRHLLHQIRAVLQSCRDPQHPALQQYL